VIAAVKDGDTVRTRTFDNDRDAKATRFGVGGNPSTGPFYVEGALPGDTLVVRLNKVRANKKTARQGGRIHARAINAGYLVGAKYDPAVTGEWTLDMEKGVATLANPTGSLKGFTVPIKTMLGCVSVAPPGALFGIGDAHAAQGDGELTGSALETSADVEFTVDVIKGDIYQQVRAETKDFLIAFGVSGSVHESIQASTTLLVEWLKKDYQMTDSEVALLVGAVMQYDIAELVDPHINVVAKVPKAALAHLKK